MGYRGKLDEQARARTLRAGGMTLLDIATRLSVSTSSVSLWVRDVPFHAVACVVPGPKRSTHPASIAKQRQIDDLDRAGIERIGRLSDDAFLAAGIALYAGEGSKAESGKEWGSRTPTPRMVVFYCAWLRRFFVVDESRVTVRVYLHEGLDLDAAERHWSALTGVPRTQFRAPYRAVADPSIRRVKHEHGCVYVTYNCTYTHRSIMGLIRALLSSGGDPG